MFTLRSTWLAMIGATACAASSLAAAADPFAVGILSCAAETDRDRRLECYDRAVVSYTAGLANGKRESTGAMAPAGESGAKSLSVVAAAAATAPSAGTGASSADAIAPAANAVAPPAGTPAPSSAAKPTPPRHLSSRISSIEHFPDYVVVHLDNQQSWKQVSDSAGGLVLRSGDPVTIDKEMGSYWLAGPKGEAVQVRLEAAKP